MTGNPGDDTYDPTTQGMPVNIVDGAGGLGTKIDSLSADVAALDTDVKALDTDVQANTAATTASTTIITGTATAPVTGGTALQLPAHACKTVMLQAAAGNDATVVYGSGVAACTIELAAGTWSPAIGIANLNMLYIKSTSAATQTVNWLVKN